MEVKNNPWKLLIITSLGVLLVMMNMSTLNVALPSITTYFQASSLEASWILLSYMLFNTVFILVFGKVADLFGRKKLYIIGISSFTILSLLCGYATNVMVLIILRALQGISGALVITNTTPMITEAFRGDKLSTALGINVVISSIAQLIGPVAGGYFTFMFNWQWVFWFNIPIGIIGTVLAITMLPKSVMERSKVRFDYYGSFIILIGLGGLIYGISSSSALGWNHISVIISLAIFAILAIIFCIVEQKVKMPIVNFKLFREQTFSMANLTTFLNALARSSVALLMALFFQLVYEANAFEAGLWVLPLALGTVVASMLIGKLSTYFRTRTLTTVGLLISTTGMGLLAFNMSLESSFVALTIGQLFIGFGSGIFMTPNTQLIMLSVPRHSTGVANGLRSMLQNMGGVLSTALSLMIVASAVPSYLKKEIYSGANANVSVNDLLFITQGFQLAFIITMIVTFVAATTAFFTGVTKLQTTSIQVKGKHDAA